MEKMKVIYEQNPALGDAQQVAQRLMENQAKIEELQSEIEEFKVMMIRLSHYIVSVLRLETYFLNRRAVFKVSSLVMQYTIECLSSQGTVYMPHPPNYLIILLFSLIPRLQVLYSSEW